MESRDLELGEVDKIQNTVQRLLAGAKNQKNHRPNFSPSIFIVPGILRDVSPSCFNPRVVSIGPLHRDDNNVQALEAWKSSYMISLMRRVVDSPQDEIMKSCVEKVYNSIDRIKACYVWNKTYNDEEIAEMMVLDACFILEFSYQMQISGQISFIDTFSSRNVCYDLLFLENQIPFFILDEIFHCTVLKFKPNTSFINFILPVIFSGLFKTESLNTDNISTDTTHHILSLLHQCYKPDQAIIIPKSRAYVTTPSVVDLDRAGVNFKPNQHPKWVMGMEVEVHRFITSFWSWSKPTFRLPILQVDDGTEFILKNLIAYEQICETGTYFTSYAAIMDDLVNTPADVAKLVESGVIHNIMGSNEEAADMINGLCKHVQLVGDFHYTEQSQILKEYSNHYWPKQISKMRSTYFNGPWNIIALFAGILLFILTILQTIFTIKSAT